MDQCSNVLRSLQDSFVFAFELADSEVEQSPERLIEAVQSEPVQKAIKAALNAEAKRLMKQQAAGAPMPRGEGTKVLTKLARAVPPALQTRIQGEALASPDFIALKRSLDQLQCSFKQSPVGMWVDANKGLLIGVAAGLAVGGAVAMYVLEEGDAPARLLTDLAAAAKDSLKTEVLGVLEVGVTTVKFVPSAREVLLGGFAAADLKGVKLKASVRGSAKKDEFAAASGTFQIAVPLGSDGRFSGKANVAAARDQSPAGRPAGPVQLSYDVGLKVDLKDVAGVERLSLQLAADARSKVGKHGISATAGSSYRADLGGLDGTLRVSGGVQHELGQPGPEYSVKVGLGVDF